MNLRSLTHAVMATLAVSAFNVACVARAELAGPAEPPPPPAPPPPEPPASDAPEPPPPVAFSDAPVLVTVEPGIWVVQDADYPVYRVDDYYWVYRDNIWYRSPYYSGGWAVVGVGFVPQTIVHRDQRMYVHYRGAPNAPRQRAPVERPQSVGAREAAGARPERAGQGEAEGRPAPAEDARVRGTAPANASTVSQGVRPAQAPEQARAEHAQEPAKPQDDIGSERAMNARPMTAAPPPAPVPRSNANVAVRRATPPPPKKH
jgi:hypothetical protein